MDVTLTASYQKAFDQAPSKLLWAGLAKLAGGVVYKGLQTVSGLRLNDEAWLAATLRGHNSLARVIIQSTSGYQSREAAFQNEWFLEREFLTMHKAIFEDLAWQHEAYLQEGLPALTLLNLAEPGALPSKLVLAWKQIDSGLAPYVNLGNETLLRREQSDILQRYYDEIGEVPLGLALSLQAKPPLPGGRSFEDVEGPGGNIANFGDRWNWIKSDMLPAWEAMSASARQVLVDSPLGSFVQ